MTRLRSMGIESVAYILLYLAETASALPKKSRQLSVKSHPFCSVHRTCWPDERRSLIFYCRHGSPVRPVPTALALATRHWYKYAAPEREFAPSSHGRAERIPSDAV